MDLNPLGLEPNLIRPVLMGIIYLFSFENTILP